jgi:hypothetical protein
MLQRTFPAGFIAPCLPTKTGKLPSGSDWLHEIKHDGFRIIARKTGAQLMLYSRPGNDLTRPACRRVRGSSSKTSATQRNGPVRCGRWGSAPGPSLNRPVGQPAREAVSS